MYNHNDIFIIKLPYFYPSPLAVQAQLDYNKIEGVVARNKTTRSKPPRNSRNCLPPVAERTSKHIERPSVPPPERPDSYNKSASISSEEVFEESDKAIELDDISISLNSSESDIYNDCHMSFMDDTDNEEDASSRAFKKVESSKNMENAKVKERSVHFCEKVIDINKFKKPNVTFPSETKTVAKKSTKSEKTTKVEKIDTSKVTSDYDSETQPSNDESSLYSKDCYFVGGTPTWFDHYGDDKRQSNTLWFATGDDEDVNYYESPIIDTNKDSQYSKSASLDKKYRTVIEVGSGEAKNNTVSGTSIKLRVNSESQHTRL